MGRAKSLTKVETVMPKIVDHDERRQAIVNGMWKIVQRDGFEAVSVIGVSSSRRFKAAGESSGVVPGVQQGLYQACGSDATSWPSTKNLLDSLA